MREMTQACAFNVPIKDGGGRILEQRLENGIEPKLEKPERATWVKIFVSLNLFDNLISFFIKSSKRKL